MAYRTCVYQVTFDTGAIVFYPTKREAVQAARTCNAPQRAIVECLTVRNDVSRRELAVRLLTGIGWTVEDGVMIDHLTRGN